MNIEDPENILSMYEKEIDRINSRDGDEDPLSIDEI